MNRSMPDEYYLRLAKGQPSRTASLVDGQPRGAYKASRKMARARSRGSRSYVNSQLPMTARLSRGQRRFFWKNPAKLLEAIMEGKLGAASKDDVNDLIEEEE